MHYVIGWLISGGGEKTRYLYGLHDIRHPYDSYSEYNINKADKFDQFENAKQWAMAFDKEDKRIGESRGTIIVEVSETGTRQVFYVKNQAVIQDCYEEINIFTRDWA